MPVELRSGHVTSHRLPIFVNEEDSRGEDMCIHDVQVEVMLEHSCVKGIEYIKLTGPGSKNAADHDAPQSRDYETKVSLDLFCLTCYTFNLCTVNVFTLQIFVSSRKAEIKVANLHL